MMTHYSPSEIAHMSAAERSRYLGEPAEHVAVFDEHMRMETIRRRNQDVLRRFDARRRWSA